MEVVQTKLTEVSLSIIDAYDLLKGIGIKEMESIAVGAIKGSKKPNATLKAILDLEEQIADLRVTITKAALKASLAPEPTAEEKVTNEDPQATDTNPSAGPKRGRKPKQTAETECTKAEQEPPVEQKPAPVAPVESKSTEVEKPAKKTAKKTPEAEVANDESQTPAKKSNKVAKLVEEPKPTTVEHVKPVEEPKVEEKRLNPYNVFFKENRGRIAAENPTMNAAEITAELARQWNALKSGGVKQEVPVVESTPVTVVAPIVVAAVPVAVAEVVEETVVDAKEPLHLRRKKIPKAIRTLVWNKYIGSDITAAKCMCCKEEKISMNNWHCGHVLAEAKGGDTTINNLRPICAPCNSSMGTKSMNEFTEEFFGWTI
jgi:hypothetical protein